MSTIEADTTSDDRQFRMRLIHRQDTIGRRHGAVLG